MNIGILGGTFDPIHLGHLRIAEESGEALALEKVFLVPSSSPPHKSMQPVSPFHHRLAMVKIAAEGSPLLEALDLEGRRQGYSYSIETLKELKTMFRPEPELFFILGIDAFLEIETWKEYKSLFEYAHFAVIQRAGYGKIEIEPFLRKIRTDIRKSENPDIFETCSEKKVYILTLSSLKISSTDLRWRVANNKSIRFLVPEAIREYIMNNGIYQ